MADQAASELKKVVSDAEACLKLTQTVCTAGCPSCVKTVDDALRAAEAVVTNLKSIKTNAVTKERYAPPSEHNVAYSASTGTTTLLIAKDGILSVGPTTGSALPAPEVVQADKLPPTDAAPPSEPAEKKTRVVVLGQHFGRVITDPKCDDHTRCYAWAHIHLALEKMAAAVKKNRSIKPELECLLEALALVTRTVIEETFAKEAQAARNFTESTMQWNGLCWFFNQQAIKHKGADPGSFGEFVGRVAMHMYPAGMGYGGGALETTGCCAPYRGTAPEPACPLTFMKNHRRTPFAHAAVAPATDSESESDSE